jgi:hypothetical protein
MRRLQEYYAFDAAIVDDVDQAAELQNRLNFAELADKYNVANGSSAVLPDGATKPIEVMTLTPKHDYDEHAARVYHTAFGYPVNKNTALHAMRMFEADDSEQLIVIGNPAMVGMKTGKLSLRQSHEVYKNASLRPAVDAPLRYLEQAGITHTKHLGYSYGADKAATTIAESGTYSQVASRGVLIEPVSVVERSMIELVKAFGESGKVQRQYIDQTESRPYDEIWSEDSIVKAAAWGAGLVRMSNLAIASILASDGFKQRASDALQANDETDLVIGWGTSSELCPGDTLQAVTNSLRAQHGLTRVESMPITGMHHAGVDDLDLHAAVMLQGIHSTSRRE